MTIIDWGLLSILFIALVCVVGVVIRIIPRLIVIDLATIAHERESQVRARLLRERIRRHVGALLRWQPIHTFAHRLDHLAHRLAADEVIQVVPSRDLLARAEQALKEQQYALAEELVLRVLREQPKSGRAYVLLGRIKAATHARREAIETLQFALHLLEKERSHGFLAEGEGEETVERHPMTDHEYALVHSELGALLVEEGNTVKALEHHLEASQLVPNDPKILDALLSLAILVQKRELASETLERLRTVNPENEKIGDFERQIKEISLTKSKKRK